jgi:hypothetical protein
MGIYDVFMDKKIVGHVCVTKEGLYTKFVCQCKLPDKELYRLVLSCCDKETDLGICVPQGEYYMVNKDVPNKKIGEGKMEFTIVTKRIISNFIPLRPGAPFPYLSELANSRFAVENGAYGILITDHSVSK